MNMIDIFDGVVHKIPSDVQEVLISNSKLIPVWNSLTPLSRNEWICWITIVKKQETRRKHLDRLVTDLTNGKRRPCCWAGCPHRKLSK